MNLLAPVLLTLSLTGQGENRWWLADVELTGPFERVVLDCGEEGSTVFHGPYLKGERTTERVPLPVVSPLGVTSLGSVPAPAIEVVEYESFDGGAAFHGWSAAQPAGDWEAVPPGLRARPRPPVEVLRPRAPWSALLLVCGAFALGFGLRRRPWAVAAVACAGAIATVWLVRPLAEGVETVVLEGDVDAAHWVIVSAGAGRLPVDDPASVVRVESEPDGAPLLFERDGADWSVRLAGGALYAIRRTPGLPDLGTARWTGAFDAVWTRDAAGSWAHRGPWVGGNPLPGQVEGDDPPGWLRAGLPPGRTVLVGRTPAGTWTRVTGVELP